MTRKEQMRLVDDMTEYVSVNIRQLILKEVLPARWTGLELRQYVADVAGEWVITMSASQKNEYKNDKKVNGL